MRWLILLVVLVFISGISGCSKCDYYVYKDNFGSNFSIALERFNESYQENLRMRGKDFNITVKSEYKVVEVFIDNELVNKSLHLLKVGVYQEDGIYEVSSGIGALDDEGNMYLYEFC